MEDLEIIKELAEQETVKKIVHWLRHIKQEKELASSIEAGKWKGKEDVRQNNR